MEFIRGDTFYFSTLLSYSDKTPVLLNDIETIFVTCRKYPNINFPIIFQKTLEDVTLDEQGVLHIAFEKEDTEDLDYGQYFFDIEVTLKSGYRKSVLKTFTLKQETTIHIEVEEDGN